MATIGFAMWLQASDLASTNRLIMIFIGLIAAAVLITAVVLIAVAVTASKAVKELMVTAGEMKTKMLPLIESATETSRTSQALLQDMAPKVKRISDALVDASDTLAESSKTARSAVQQFDTTLTDINQRTQKQVARVDGMVTSTLTATVDAVEMVGRGIRMPAQKVAEAVSQVKYFAEGVFASIRDRNGTRS